MENILTYLSNNIIGLLNVLVAFFLFREAKKMRDISTKPELVFYLTLTNRFMVAGRLENIGNGIAYNIEVNSNKDFKTFRGESINDAFKELSYLAPKQAFDIQYGHINIGNEIIEFEDHTLTVYWSSVKKNSKNKQKAKFFLSKTFFKNSPRPTNLSHLEDAIKKVADSVLKLNRK